MYTSKNGSRCSLLNANRLLLYTSHRRRRMAPRQAQLRSISINFQLLGLGAPYHRLTGYLMTGTSLTIQVFVVSWLIAQTMPIHRIYSAPTATQLLPLLSLLQEPQGHLIPLRCMIPLLIAHLYHQTPSRRCIDAATRHLLQPVLQLRPTLVRPFHSWRFAPRLYLEIFHTSPLQSNHPNHDQAKLRSAPTFRRIRMGLPSPK